MLSLKIKGEIRSFPDKKKIKECVNTQSSTATNVKGITKEEEKEKEKNTEENSLTIKCH